MTAGVKQTYTPKEARGLLVEALRSGKYKQAKNYLTVVANDGSETDCCLGVACKIYSERVRQLDYQVIELSFDGSVVREYARSDRTRGTYKEMPKEVYEWFGFCAGEPRLTSEAKGRTHYGVITSANDDDVDFPTLARWIEEGLIEVRE